MLNRSQVIEKVADFCYNRLLKDEKALSYLIDKRKLTLASLGQFKIGLFPQDLRELFEIEDAKILREVGIIKNASKGMFRMWDLVIPVQDVYGNYIAMAGRTRLTEAERQAKNIPKYMNSAYAKSHHLFGLNFAKRHIIKDNVAYVVEGYFDVITSIQAGLNNVVASCSGSLSTRHLSLLARYTDNIVLLLDNEPEAQKRARKIVEKKQHKGITLTSANPLPENIKDLDEFFQTYSLDDLFLRINNKANYERIEPLW